MPKKKLKTKIFDSWTNFTKHRALFFAGLFAFVGIILLLRGFAASLEIARVEAESIAPLPAGATVIQKPNASGGKYVQFTQVATLSGQFEILTPATSVGVYASAKNCGGSYPTVNVKVDGATVFSPVVKSLTGYTQDINLTAGTHTFAVEVTNLPTAKSCVGSLGLDYFVAYGSDAVPPPTVSLSASPSSIAPGASSTLTWASTDATDCTASGAWSGTKALSGSTSTGAISSTATYSLACTGQGGSASASTTVTVIPTPPVTDLVGPGIALPNKSAFRTVGGAFELDNAQQMGAKWIRLDLGYEHNSYYDAIVSGTMNRGMKVLAQMGSTGKAALGQTGVRYTPTTYLQVVNNEVPWYYAMGARDFEILNEPNLNGYTAADYLAIVQAAYPRIKQLAPSARVWVGAIGIGQAPCGAGCQFSTFVKPLFPAIASYMDGFSIHASDMSHPPLGSDRTWSMQSWTWGPLGDGITDTIRSEMDGAGASAKPILLTEYNYPDNKPDLATQATRVVDNICDARYPGVANYTVEDDDVLHFGMLTLSLTKKPVWTAFQSAAAKLASGGTCP